ncbi:MAG: hypothetical protein AAFX87_10845 [Bacteroidota bacterium]
MSIRIKFALKAYGIALIPLTVLLIISSEPSEIWSGFIWLAVYALLWIAVPAYFVGLFYEFVISLRKQRQERNKARPKHQNNH